MKVIRESSEHHFLTTLDQLKRNPKGWIVVRFALSKAISHTDIIKDTTQIDQKIKGLHSKGRAFFEDVKALAVGLEVGFLYQFPDNDILLLARADNESDKNHILSIYQQFSEKLDSDMADTGALSNEIYAYQKLADKKLLAGVRFDSYRAMSNQNKLSSLSVRRARRDDPVVMMVEDDRFTASYASSILNKDYELIICKNGEESIVRYIDAAPDIVLLDIHLPGLSGHQTLQAIKAIDPEAFVVMMSVDTVRESIVKASHIGAKSFLKKPFSKERLINTVKASPFINGLGPSGSMH